MFGGQKRGRPDACDEHLAALVFFSGRSFRAFPVLFYMPSMRTPYRTQETAHFETILPMFCARGSSSKVLPGLLHLCTGSSGPLIERTFNPTSTRAP